MIDSETAMREAFEKWAKVPDNEYARLFNGDYSNGYTHAQWEGWQAARTITPEELEKAARTLEPYLDEYMIGQGMLLEATKAAAHAFGLTVKEGE